jgi:hypothetical protein
MDLSRPPLVVTFELSERRKNALTIEVNTDKPTLLLITDLYERGWRAEPPSGSVQQSYRIMPADYILRVIPLMAGHHRLRVVYAPTEFLVGISISAVAWMLWAVIFYFVPSSRSEETAVSRPQAAEGTKVTDTGKHFKVPGQPGSARMSEH